MVLFFSLSFFITAQKSVFIQKENFQLIWRLPKNIDKEVEKFQKLELAIRLNRSVEDKIKVFLENNKDGLNPYNPDDINVAYEFTSPLKEKRTAFAFYNIPYVRNGNSWSKVNSLFNWVLRFSPDQIGEWNYTLNISIKGELIDTHQDKFVCIESESKGRLIIKKGGRYLQLSNSDDPFFVIGHNIAHSAYYKVSPKKADLHKKWLTELAESGGNFYRLELGAQNALPDWNDYKNYSSKMEEMFEMDQLIEYSENLGLYFILFRHHTEIENGSDWDVAYWHNNPYKIGFELKGREEYFKNKEIIKWQKNTLRYIFSRWGYSSSFAFYEYQEVDNWYEELQHETNFSDKEAITFFKNWYVDQKEYIQDYLGAKQLFMSTYASTPKFEFNKKNNGMFANSDVVGFHRYGQNKEDNYINKYEQAIDLYKEWNKPVLVEEMGVTASAGTNFLALYKCSGVEFHNSIWATSFMGTAGTGMNWWWDRGVHDFKRYEDYKVLSNFFKDEKMNLESYEPQKWHNKISIKRTLIENYALKNESATKVLGWVHNATHYWRNINNPCLEELKIKGHFTTPYKLKDGVYLGKEDKTKTNFNSRTDAYSKDGVQNVAHQKIEIKGLKGSSFFGVKEWYEIQFNSTTSGLVVDEQIIKTNIWGKIKPTYPEKDEPDFSYKINYLGKSRKEPK